MDGFTGLERLGLYGVNAVVSAKGVSTHGVAGTVVAVYGTSVPAKTCHARAVFARRLKRM